MHAADILPITEAGQTQSSLDLFLIFVGANIAATTFQVGASLAESFTLATATTLIGVGSVAGSGLVASLAPVGSRLRVPSVVAARAALGFRGAGLVALVLYVSNFAWIALNNVIAASAITQVAAARSLVAGPLGVPIWAVLLGLLATIIVWRGPAAVARADRVAVPLMLVVAVALTVACLRSGVSSTPVAPAALSWSRGLDVVVGYQVSWILMFADYPRYTRSARGSTTAVFLGLAATSIWMMPLGAIAARAAGTSDPGAMLATVGLGAAGALLLVLATVTTNFVNIYMSALAWKSLAPATNETTVVWSIGIIGAVASAVPGVWLAQYTNFMMVLGALLVPVGGILVAHFYFPRPVVVVDHLYDPAGPYRGFCTAGIAAWIAGAIAYFAAGSIGGTLPALAASMIVYELISAQALNRIDRGGAPRRQ